MTSQKKCSFTLECPACHKKALLSCLAQQEPGYCAFCGHKLEGPVDTGSAESSTGSGLTTSTISILEDLPPTSEETRFHIGPYQVVSKVGKGGMGEVFLAHDPVCGRRIALKRIRSDLVDDRKLHDRFLKEARITSQLTHPAIIPIYTIHNDKENLYYTMPYVEGETFKAILRTTRHQEKQGKKLHHIDGSIPALTRIFVTIRQAVAYAHSKDVLHRDLKPKNIIVGKYGEVLILDWGLAKLLDSPTSEAAEASAPGSSPAAQRSHKLTHMAA